MVDPLSIVGVLETTLGMLKIRGEEGDK